TAGAEHHDELALRIGPQRLQRLRQRIGLVRIIDEDRRAVVLADTLQPSLGAFEMFEARKHGVRLAPGGYGKPRRHQRILDLEGADQRQFQRYRLAAMLEHKLLRKAVDAGFNEADALALSVAPGADRHEPQSAYLCRVDHLVRTIMIGRDRGSAAGRNQI